MAEMKLREAGRTQMSGYKVEIAALTDSLTIQDNAGLQITAHCRYRDLHEPIDTLLIAGGMEIWSPSAASDLFDWLRRTASSVRRLGSLCTGTFLLAEAGLLDGRRVTTHWYFCQRLAEQFPKIIVDSEPIFIRDGNLATAAGGTSNLDLALAMVDEDLGTDIAIRIARGLVLFLRRSANQTQFSAALAFQDSSRIGLRELPVFILENLDQPLGVDMLAAQVSMSIRNFSRTFRLEFGATPAAFVEKLRLETARRLVLESPNSLAEIAGSCGLGGVDTMRRAFQRAFGQSPADMRATHETQRALELSR